MSFLTSIGKGLVGALTGFAAGGPAGAIAGAGISLLGGGGSSSSSQPYGPPPGFAAPPTPGLSGLLQIPIPGTNMQINPLAGAPGGVPLFQQRAAAPSFSGGNKSLAAAMVLSGQVPAITQVQQAQRFVAPPGYVLVQGPNGPMAMLKELAYALGLKKRPRKSGISRRDIQGAYRVQGFVRKLTTCKPKHPLKKRGGAKRR